MELIYSISGFSNYLIRNKILYRKSYKVRMRNNNWQYRAERKINRVKNNGIEGYILYKDNKRKFYSLERLRHRLIKNSEK